MFMKNLAPQLRQEKLLNGNQILGYVTDQNYIVFVQIHVYFNGILLTAVGDSQNRLVKRLGFFSLTAISENTERNAVYYYCSSLSFNSL